MTNTSSIARYLDPLPLIAVLRGITPEEVEQAFANDPMDLGADVVDAEERYTGVGHTNRFRVLVLVWTMRGDATRPISAFDASDRLAARYLAERGI